MKNKTHLVSRMTDSGSASSQAESPGKWTWKKLTGHLTVIFLSYICRIFPKSLSGDVVNIASLLYNPSSIVLILWLKVKNIFFILWKKNFIGYACAVAELCLTLCDSMDCSPPGFSVHGVFQVRILEWVAISYPRGSFWPRDPTHVSCVSCIGREILHHCATWEAQFWLEYSWFTTLASLRCTAKWIS